MAATKSLSVMSPDGGLSRYLTEIRKFPMLAKDQEFMLAKAWREHGDSDSAHKLVTSHLRLVAKIAMGYRGYGLPIGEVICPCLRTSARALSCQSSMPFHILKNESWMCVASSRVSTTS